MAIGVTAQQAAVAIRAATAIDNIDPTVLVVVEIAFKAACALVIQHAPDAPADAQNAAAIRLTGWLYDSDPTDISASQLMRVSGASAILAQWRVHRAGAISGPGTAPGPGPSPTPGAGLPAIPASGEFILAAVDGELTWLEFPQP